MIDYTQSLLFKNITSHEIERMSKCSMAAQKQIESGETIFGQDDKPVFIYLLLEGQVIITKYLPSGRRDILMTAAPGDVFGEVFFFAKEEYYWYDAVAVKKSKVLMLPYSFVYGFCASACEHHKQLIHNLLGIQSQCNLEMMKKLHIVTGTTLKQKVGLWMDERLNEKNEVKLDMTREELADYLGVTRPSLSRTLTQMQEDGIVSIHGKLIKVTDIELFEELFEE